MRGFLRFLLWLVIITAVVVGVARALAIRWFWVPDDLVMSASVAPTLRGGDLVILWRATKPSYGDLVVCPEPDSEGWVVGRLLGVGGDVIEVRGDRILRNGTPISSESSCGEFTVLDPDTENNVMMRCSLVVAGGRKFTVGDAGGHARVPRSVKDELMPGEAFLVSDNHLYPYDSRDYGAVMSSTCTESVVFRLVGAGGWGDTKSRLTVIR